MLYREAIADRRARLVQDQMSLLANGQALLLQRNGTPQDSRLTIDKRLEMQSRRRSYDVRSQAILKTPTWLSHTVWEMAVERAISGWTFTFRSYSLWRFSSSESPIFDACMYGDLACIQRSFDRREALPFDEIDSRFKTSLLDVGHHTAQMHRMCLS